MHILDQLMNSVVRIEAEMPDNSISTGTGFAYHFAQKEDGTQVPAIVTNKHVIDGAISISFPLSIADAAGSPSGKYEVVKFPINSGNILRHPDKEVDLCAIAMAPILQHFENKGQKCVLIHLDKTILADVSTFTEILPLDEVTMIGFPNGLWDNVNNGSIARRGVIATIPEHDYLGKKQFVIDMACFPGSSGSPVFLANFGNYSDRKGNLIMGTRIKLLGVLYAGPQHTASGEIVLKPIPTQNKPITFTSMPNNLGYVIKATELLEIEAIASNLK